jgi:ABC-type multidrug transport system ATPase subunit
MEVYAIVNLTKIYPQQITPANERITLAIESGEIFGLLGDNGAGKTRCEPTVHSGHFSASASLTQ